VPDYHLRLENFQPVQYSRRHTIERRKHQAVNIAKRQSLRRFAPQHVELMISASNAARDRNSPVKTYQINLQRSLIESDYQPIRGRGQPF